MRTIDADALKELFSEVIGHIAQKPEMNGNLEHMIRASAMVIQMIDDAPTVQPDTTTHDSIPAETGGNDGDRTSGDCISRQQAIMAIEQHRIAVLEGHKWDEGIEYGYAAAHRHLVDIIENLPFAQPETNCSEIPNNSDTISRQQAIEVLRNRWLKTRNYEGIGEDIAEECEIYLKTLPSVQPERKTGRWIWQKRFYTFDGEKREILVKVCSYCGKPPIAGVESPYCPHCGEKKEGEQE